MNKDLPRPYSDHEWTRAVEKEWKTYDPVVELSSLKFFRRNNNISRPPRWSIGAGELWNMKRRELEGLMENTINKCLTKTT